MEIPIAVVRRRAMRAPTRSGGEQGQEECIVTRGGRNLKMLGREGDARPAAKTYRLQQPPVSTFKHDIARIYILLDHGSLSSQIQVYHRTSPPYCKLHMLLSCTVLWIIVARRESYSMHSRPSRANFWIFSVTFNHGGNQMFGAPPFQIGKQSKPLYSRLDL